MKKTEANDILTALILVLIGAVIMVVFVIFIQVHATADNTDICNRIRAQKNNNSTVHKTYTPEPKVCKMEK